MTVAVLDEPTPPTGREGFCAANKRQSEGWCHKPSGWGTNHPGTGRCRLHGGNTRDHRNAAARTIAEAKARELFGKTLDDTPVHNPLEVFAELAGEVRGWLKVMRQLVADLTSPGYAALTGEQIKAEVQLYERAMDRANTVLATYARLNIDSRLAAISEAQGRIVLGAIQAALASAGVVGPRAIEAGRVAAAKMRVLEAEAAAVNVEDDRERP